MRLRVRAVSAVAVNSPDAAESLVAGSSANGWIEWRNGQGQTLDEVYRQQG